MGSDVVDLVQLNWPRGGEVDDSTLGQIQSYLQSTWARIIKPPKIWACSSGNMRYQAVGSDKLTVMLDGKIVLLSPTRGCPQGPLHLLLSSASLD